MLKLLFVGALGIGTFAPSPQPSRHVHGGPYAQLFRVKPIDIVLIEDGKVLPKGARPSPKSPAHGVLEFPARQHAPKHTVERGACNMPIIVADASVDPGILIFPPKTHGKPAIRAIEPPACWTK
jgi:hypothetical protein